MKAVETPARISQLLTNLKDLYKSSFELECAVYRELRGPHNKQTRKEVARYLNLPYDNYNVVELAEHIRTHFDQLRLF